MMNNLQKLNGKNVVVTGAGGYIGSALVEELVKHSCDVVRVGRNNLLPITNTRIIKGDVCNPSTWNEIAEKADIIFHLAGNTSLKAAADRPDESIYSTLMPLFHLANALKHRKTKPKVVLASTATVYGLTPSEPVSETFPAIPLTVYDLHKLFAEQQLALASHQEILHGVSLRISNVYGPSIKDNSSKDRGVLNKIAKMAISGLDLNFYGNGSYKRDYVYISDVVNAFLVAAVGQNIIGESFNIASGTSTSIKEAFLLVAHETKKRTGHVVNVRSVPIPETISPIELRSFTANNDKFYQFTGWQPKVHIKEGIALLVKDLDAKYNNKVIDKSIIKEIF